MAHIAFPENIKTFKVPSSSTTYGYICIPPSSSQPTILFLHGFPSSSYDWRNQISHFSSLGYGVLVPDLLGYGGTDKPSSPKAYLGKKMATEVMDILDHERLDKVHVVAHDFGSHLLSQIVYYFPSRLHSCTFIAVPYSAPGQHFDLDKVKEITEKALGFEKYGYMRFMIREDSPEILAAHVRHVSIYSRYDRLKASFPPKLSPCTSIRKRLLLLSLLYPFETHSLCSSLRLSLLIPPRLRSTGPIDPDPIPTSYPIKPS
jgi:pimeloyl-ACP methyl ester carboxylesterase